jgi:lipid-A-disaccharide synthase-like uncharacterized protein
MAWNIVLSYPFGIIGILGLALILVAWIPQTLATIKTKKVGMRREFIILYLLGSLFLAIHSIIIDDFVFLILNAGATFVASVNLYYSLISKSKS